MLVYIFCQVNHAFQVIIAEVAFLKIGQHIGQFSFPFLPGNVLQMPLHF